MLGNQSKITEICPMYICPSSREPGTTRVWLVSVIKMGMGDYRKGLGFYMSWLYNEYSTSI